MEAGKKGRRGGGNTLNTLGCRFDSRVGREMTIRQSCPRAFLMSDDADATYLWSCDQKLCLCVCAAQTVFLDFEFRTKVSRGNGLRRLSFLRALVPF